MVAKVAQKQLQWENPKTTRSTQDMSVPTWIQQRKHWLEPQNKKI